MTWLDAVPTVAICTGLLCGIGITSTLHDRWSYRGLTDSRVMPEYGGRFTGHSDALSHRLAQRDQRLSLFPQTVQWVHPIWRPKCYPESK